MIEYLRSLNDLQIPVQELNDLLITSLLQEKHGLSRLHYLLQYRVLADSKPLVNIKYCLSSAPCHCKDFWFSSLFGRPVLYSH